MSKYTVTVGFKVWSKFVLEAATDEEAEEKAVEMFDVSGVPGLIDHSYIHSGVEDVEDA